MTILFSAERFYPPLGGGELSVYSLLEELGKRNDVHAISVGDINKDFTVNGVYIHQRKNVFFNRPRWVSVWVRDLQWRKILSKFLQKIKPEVIITQAKFAHSTVKTAKENNIPSILFIRSYVNICPVGFVNRNPFSCRNNCLKCISIKSKVQYFFVRVVMKEYSRAIKDADVVIANSNYVANVIKKRYGISTEVVYPFIKLDKYIANEKQPRYITFNNPTITKGAEIVYQIARRMNNMNFLIIGKGHASFLEKIKKLKNITRVPWIDDMKKVYAKTKILLIPSLWPEPFGRVAVEAMANGIPCVTSNRGALPEVVGNAGIIVENPFNIDRWVNAINKLTRNATFYKELSRESKKQSEKFRFEEQHNKFKKILEKLT